MLNRKFTFEKDEKRYYITGEPPTREEISNLRDIAEEKYKTLVIVYPDLIFDSCISENKAKGNRRILTSLMFAIKALELLELYYTNGNDLGKFTWCDLRILNKFISGDCKLGSSLIVRCSKHLLN